MSEIENLAEKEIKKKIYELETMLNNFDKLMPNFKQLREKRQEIKDNLEQDLLIWKIILKNFKKSIYKI